jgi:hypothetical protein
VESRVGWERRAQDGRLSERRAGISSTQAQLGMVMSSRRQGRSGPIGRGGVRGEGEGPAQASLQGHAFPISQHVLSRLLLLYCTRSVLLARCSRGFCIDGEPQTSPHDLVPSGTSGIFGSFRARAARGCPCRPVVCPSVGGTRNSEIGVKPDEQENWDDHIGAVLLCITNFR